jgi:signal transduction histidine kinase
MSSPTDQKVQAPIAGDAQRETIHDLRNLFGIVASASHVLEHDPEPSRRSALLEAIEAAAMRGGALTTDLLARREPPRATASIDIGARLADLAPLAGALAGKRLGLDLQIGYPNAHARIDPDGFEAAILELVANATAADARTILIRSRKIGSSVWILISDDGHGMSPDTLARARMGLDAGTSHGSGLSRAHRFARNAHGHLLIRSRPLAGTSIALILPTVLSISVDEPTTPPRSVTPCKETINEEDRQPIAA